MFVEAVLQRNQKKKKGKAVCWLIGKPFLVRHCHCSSGVAFTLPGARTYDHLKKTREEERLKRTMLSEVLQYIQDSSACQQWLRRQADM